MEAHQQGLSERFLRDWAARRAVRDTFRETELQPTERRLVVDARWVYDSRREERLRVAPEVERCKALMPHPGPSGRPELVKCACYRWHGSAWYCYAHTAVPLR